MQQTARRVSWSPRRPGPVAASAAALAACLLCAPALASGPALTITQPWIRFITPQIPAAGYFTLHNTGSAAAVLTGAASPDCGQLMLHQSVVTSGTAAMDMVRSVTVPADGSVSFSPGGYHLMCMSPSAAIKVGQTVPVSLKFQDGTTLAATFPVYGAKGK